MEKLRSVGSTYWTLLATAVATIGISVIIANSVVHRWPQMNMAARARFDPISTPFVALSIAQLAIGVLGALTFTSEQSTGLIRTTLAALPQRGVVLAGKAAVVGLLSLIVGELITFATFFLDQAFLANRGIGASITSPGVLGKVLSAGFYLFVITMLGLGLGVIIRHTAGAVAALVFLAYLTPNIVTAFPHPWNDWLGRLTPYVCLQQTESVHPKTTGLFSPGVSLLVLVIWAVVSLLAAGISLVRRDV